MPGGLCLQRRRGSCMLVSGRQSAGQIDIYLVRLQGGAKFPTGGMSAMCRRARERPRARSSLIGRFARGVSRSGAMPEPTVIVRMEEDAQTVAFAASLGSACFAVPRAVAFAPFAMP